MSDLQTLETPRSAPQKPQRKGAKGGTRGRKADSKDWTIKGLPAETVDVARDAARDSGMKINAWVSQVFEQAAAGPPPRVIEGKLGHRKDIDLEEEIRVLRIRNDELLQTINNLSQAIAKMCQ